MNEKRHRLKLAMISTVAAPLFERINNGYELDPAIPLPEPNSIPSPVAVALMITVPLDTRTDQSETTAPPGNNEIRLVARRRQINRIAITVQQPLPNPLLPILIDWS